MDVFSATPKQKQKKTSLRLVPTLVATSVFLVFLLASYAFKKQQSSIIEKEICQHSLHGRVINETLNSLALRMHSCALACQQSDEDDLVHVLREKEEKFIHFLILDNLGNVHQGTTTDCFTVPDYLPPAPRLPTTKTPIRLLTIRAIEKDKIFMLLYPFWQKEKKEVYWLVSWLPFYQFSDNSRAGNKATCNIVLQREEQLVYTTFSNWQQFQGNHTTLANLSVRQKNRIKLKAGGKPVELSVAQTFLDGDYSLFFFTPYRNPYATHMWIAIALFFLIGCLVVEVQWYHLHISTIISEETARIKSNTSTLHETLAIERLGHKEAKVAFNNLKNAIVVVEPSGKIKYLNSAFAELCNQQKNTIQTQKIEDLVSLSKHPSADNFDFSLEGVGDTHDWEGILYIRNEKNRRGRSAMVLPVRDSLGQLKSKMYIFQPRRKTETGISEKEVYASLSSHLFHEFNNLITVILGQCNLLLFGINPPNPSSKEQIKEIIAASNSSIRLINRLRLFSSHDECDREEICPREALEGMRKMLQRATPDNITVNLTPFPTEQKIETDLILFEKGILIFVLRACQAMPKGGVVNISISKEKHSPGSRTPSLAISITDTGEESVASVKQRLAAPVDETENNFTVALANQIFTQLGATIQVEGSLGEGVCVTIHIPTEDNHQLETKTGISLAATPQKTATLLIVDDEQPILNFLQTSLSREGYIVHTAVNNEQLEKLWRKHGPEIDLLISDIVMPESGGFDIARRLRIDRPELKVLMMSAYPNQVISQFGELGTDSFIQKPFPPEKMSLLVSQILSS